MDLLKDRLAHILRAKNLTATQFAELMQIQPSNVSHLLSGRNKPSFDFLIKLKEIFPEYSYEWIISGKKPITISEQSHLSHNTLFEPVEELNTAEKDQVTIERDLLSDEVASSDFVKANGYDHSKGLKQIIYVYDDHTFDIFNIRN